MKKKKYLQVASLLAVTGTTTVFGEQYVKAETPMEGNSAPDNTNQVSTQPVSSTDYVELISSEETTIENPAPTIDIETPILVTDVTPSEASLESRHDQGGVAPKSSDYGEILEVVDSNGDLSVAGSESMYHSRPHINEDVEANEGEGSLDDVQGNQEISYSLSRANTSQTFAESHIPEGRNYKIVTDIQAAKEAIADTGLEYLIISDGRNHALVQKGINGSEIGLSGWRADFSKGGVIPVVAYHDGSTDITSALNQAATTSGLLGLPVEMPEGREFIIKTQITVPTNAILHGNKSILVADASMRQGPNSGLLTVKSSSKKVAIKDFVLDMRLLPDHLNDSISGTKLAGINVNSLTDSEISGNTIIGAPYVGIRLDLTGNANNVRILHNRVFMRENMQYLSAEQTNLEPSYAIYVHGQHKTGTSLNDFTYAYGNSAVFSKEDASRPISEDDLPRAKSALAAVVSPDAALYTYGEGFLRPTNPERQAEKIEIVNNYIEGGRYGLSLRNIVNSLVQGNYITNNIRNISAQGNVSHNKFIGNTLVQSRSTGLLMNYNSDHNIVSNNIIASTMHKGQGLVQIGTGSEYNQIINNLIEGTSPDKIGGQWLMYAGPDVSGTSMIGNIISGHAFRSLLGVEGLHDNGVQNGRINSYAASSSVSFGGGFAPSSNITIRDNILVPQSSNVDAVYLAADKYDKSGISDQLTLDGSLLDLVFADNILLGERYKTPLRYFETGGGKITLKEGKKLEDGLTFDKTGTSLGAIKYGNISESALSDGEDTLYLVGTEKIDGKGGGYNNILFGNISSNTLDGSEGNDILVAGLGNDTLIGGLGADNFLINSIIGKDNISKIRDFNRAEGDKIELPKYLVGMADSNWFASATESHSLDTRVYQEGNQLFYDADGSSPSFSGILFVTLENNILLTENDIALRTNPGEHFRREEFLLGNQPLISQNVNISIEGSVRVGEQLLANISDYNGDTNNLTYQWYSDNEAIDDATEQIYNLKDSDVGKVISVQAIFTDNRENEKRIISSSTEVVEQAINQVGQVILEGDAVEGSVLTANVNDQDGLPDLLQYTWMADGVPIVGSGSESSYTISKSDIGKQISVHVHYFDKANHEEELQSDKTVAVQINPNTRPSRQYTKKETGLNLDMGRQFYSVAELKEVIQLIADLGGSFLHLRLSDNEQYALESEVLGQTLDIASRTSDGTYINPHTGKAFISLEQLRDLAQFAKDKGVDLMPEIDTPGHMKAIFELLDKKNPELSKYLRVNWNSDPQLDMAKLESLDFVKSLLDEVISSVGDSSSYIHLGGDEFAHNSEFHQEFTNYVNQLHKYLANKGYKVRLYNDGLAKSDLYALNKEIEITYWSHDGTIDSYDSQDEKLVKLREVRPTMPELLNAGFDVFNYNGYYLYNNPVGSDKVEEAKVPAWTNSEPSDFSARDILSTWTLGHWNDKNQTNIVPDTSSIKGAALSIWGEHVGSLDSTSVIKYLVNPLSALILKTKAASQADAQAKVQDLVEDNFLNLKQESYLDMEQVIAEQGRGVDQNINLDGGGSQNLNLLNQQHLTPQTGINVRITGKQNDSVTLDANWRKTETQTFNGDTYQAYEWQGNTLWINQIIPVAPPVSVNQAPTGISLSGTKVSNETVGAEVGRLTTTDPDVGDTFRYSIDDNRFEIVDGLLKLKDDQELSYATTPQVTVRVTSTDQGGLSTSQAFVLEVEAPVAPPVTLDESSISDKPDSLDKEVVQVSVGEVLKDEKPSFIPSQVFVQSSGQQLTSGDSRATTTLPETGDDSFSLLPLTGFTALLSGLVLNHRRRQEDKGR